MAIEDEVRKILDGPTVLSKQEVQAKIGDLASICATFYTELRRNKISCIPAAMITASFLVGIFTDSQK